MFFIYITKKVFQVFVLVYFVSVSPAFSRDWK